jgi:hypothetical protein
MTLQAPQMLTGTIEGRFLERWAGEFENVAVVCARAEEYGRGWLAALGLAALALTVIGAPAASGESNAVVASASGSGHMVRNGFYRTFSFSARKYADGTSKGQLQLRSPEFDVVVHLAIDCLRVVGNRAHMSGVITFTSNTDEAFVGEHNRLVVEDNGEGRAAAGAGAPPPSATPESTRTPGPAGSR